MTHKVTVDTIICRRTKQHAIQTASDFYKQDMPASAGLKPAGFLESHAEPFYEFHCD